MVWICKKVTNDQKNNANGLWSSHRSASSCLGHQYSGSLTGQCRLSGCCYSTGVTTWRLFPMSHLNSAENLHGCEIDLLLFLDLRPFVEICGRFALTNLLECVNICQQLCSFSSFSPLSPDQSSGVYHPLCTKHPVGLIGLHLDVLPWLLSQTWSSI